MTDRADVARHADETAAALGLPLAADHRDGVLDNLAILLTASRLFMEFPLPDEIEPAPVFRP